jgi:quinol-cytochrome oxidoreductase complex cytochrome b subunit
MLKELVKHLFPRLVRERDLRLSYTFCLGGLAFTSFLALIATGALLLFYYTPSPERAHASIQFLESRVWGGAYLRSLHRLSSHALLLLLALHTLRVVLTGAFLHPRRMNWIVGCSLLGLSVFAAYTGYLLPMDQLAYWATTTGMELLRALPLGGGLRAILVPDEIGGALTLLRFYALHVVVVPLAILVLAMLHFFVIRRQKGLLPYL